MSDWEQLQTEWQRIGLPVPLLEPGVVRIILAVE